MTRRITILLFFVFLLLQSGCALLQHPPKTMTAPLAKKQWHLSLRLPFFHHKPSPPRAQGLQQVGIIRTLSADQTFVIIELEPGVIIPAGRDLIVTAGAGEPIRLKAAENQPPFFIADIKSGHPCPGQTVFQ